jgi:hypothetical protein
MTAMGMEEMEKNEATEADDRKVVKLGRGQRGV